MDVSCTQFSFFFFFLFLQFSVHNMSFSSDSAIAGLQSDPLTGLVCQSSVISVLIIQTLMLILTQIESVR